MYTMKWNWWIWHCKCMEKQRPKRESEKCRYIRIVHVIVCVHSCAICVAINAFGSIEVCVLPENVINPVMEREKPWMKKNEITFFHLPSARHVYLFRLLTLESGSHGNWRMAQINAISNWSKLIIMHTHCRRCTVPRVWYILG